MTPSTWIATFLNDRKLRHPDGRALYAYRCTASEFGSLAEALTDTYSSIFSIWIERSAIRAFVLYAAEWWQRRYDGGPWAWEPLLNSVEWHGVHYPDLYEPVREALRWWRVDLVRLPTSARYLGTFACQGGLPLALVGDAHSRVTQYLRAVLKHTAAYRQFVDDPIDLAQDQQHLLRPPTLRRDYVFRLAADLTEAVLELRDDAEDGDPLGALDQTRSDWRETMPLDLDNERAQELLTGLFRHASRDRLAPVDDFRVERFLRRTGVGWRLGARVRLPASMPTEDLARRLNVDPKALPTRLQVRAYGDRVHVLGAYAEQSDAYRLMSRDAQSVISLWDVEAAGEVRLQFVSVDAVGEYLVPYRGDALGELPWAFQGDEDECPFIGEGSISSRAPEIVMLVQENDTLVSSTVSVEERVLDRMMRRITERTAIETSDGRCVVEPSSAQGIERDYLLSGRRFHNLESRWPLFSNVPRLRIARTEQAPRAVPGSEVNWRQTGQDWKAYPDTYGLWEVRHVRRGELGYRGRVGILPNDFGAQITPGSDMSEGWLELSGAEGVKVIGDDEEIEFRTQVASDGIRVHVRARDPAVVPARVRLRLHWQGSADLVVSVPFPGQGGRFLRNGKPVDGSLAIDEIFGVRATAVSSSPVKHFWVEGELNALDLDNSVLRVAYFRRRLHKSGVTQELPLVDVRSSIELLLSASSSSHARVDLRIVDGLQPQPGALQVRRFSGTVRHCDGMAFVDTEQTSDTDPAMTFEVMSISRPDDDPVRLDVVEVEDAPHAMLPRDVDQPWLVIARHEEQVRVRPIVVGGRASQEIDESPSLPEALRLEDSELRRKNIAAALDALLLDGGDARSVEDDWAFLTHALLRAEGLPATSFDLLKVLVTKPRLLVRCMFRLESAPRQLLWGLEDELPFSWLLIGRSVWMAEAKQAFGLLRSELADVRDGERIARDHIDSILAEGVSRMRALYTVQCDVGLRLMGLEVPKQIVAEAIKKRDDGTQTQLAVRYSMNDWPKGDGRREWVNELDRGRLLDELGIWQQDGEIGERQPAFDTPVAAAWCCFGSKLAARTIFLVKRIRAHDPEWFDLAYEAAWFRLAFRKDRAGK